MTHECRGCEEDCDCEAEEAGECIRCTACWYRDFPREADFIVDYQEGEDGA